MQFPIESSPRVWGQAEYSVDAFNRLGIIPTRVGTSCGVHRNNNQGWDHPHACGDKSAYRKTAA